MDATLPQLLAAIDGWQASAIALKALTYGTSFVAGGGVLFLTFFWNQLDERDKRGIERVIVNTACAGMVFSVLRVAVMNGMMSDDLSGMFSVAMTRMVLTSNEGLALALRLVGLGLITMNLGARIRTRFPVAALSGAFLAILSFGLTGHASELAHETGYIPGILICAHLLAVAFWLGALWPLYRLTRDDDIGKVAAIMHQFGRLAAFVVAILIVVGAALLWWLLGNSSALWQSAYGQAMIAKLTVVTLLLVLAATNKLHLTPRLRNGDQAAVTVLRRSIGCEIVVACLILSITACLTAIVGPPALN